MARVLLTTQTVSDVHGTVDEFCYRLGRAHPDHEIVRWVERGRPGHVRANKMAKWAIEGFRDPWDGSNHEPFDWWFQIDCDNTPSRDPLDELLELALPLVILPTPMLVPALGTVQWNVNPLPDHPLLDGTPNVERIKWGGTGAFFADVTKMAGLQKPLFDWSHDAADVEKASRSATPDRMFNWRWEAAGHPIHAHWGYPCHHWRANADLLTIEGIGSLPSSG